MYGLMANPQMAINNSSLGGGRINSGSIPSGPSLAPYLNTIVGSGDIFHTDPSQDPNMQSMLGAIQKYDPNAHFADAGYSDNDVPNWDLVFDQTKVPGADGKTPLMNPSALKMPDSYVDQGFNTPSLGFQTANNRSDLINPNLKYNSPVWGNITPNNNIKPDYGSGLMGFLGRYMPMVTAAVLAGAGGMAGGAALGGLGSVGSMFGSALGKMLPGQLMNLGYGGKFNFNPLSLAGSALGMIPGMGQIMPYLNAARNIYGATHGNLGSMMNLGQMAYNGFGGH